MNASEQKAAAKKFVTKWLAIEKNEGKIGEKQYDQAYWDELLRTVFGVCDASYLDRQKFVYINGQKKFLDLYIKDTKVLIEQKSSDIDLDKAERQSDGQLKTPYEQAERYAEKLDSSETPAWIVVSNFKEIRIYDTNKKNQKQITCETVKLEDLPKEYYRLNFLIDKNDSHTNRETEISKGAGKLVGTLYDELLKQYKDPTNEHSLKSLNMLCVRLVFCLYAEDAGLFGEHNKFGNYLKSFNPENVRKGLIELFEVLNTKIEDRDPYMNENLAAFPYVNGGLFAENNIEIPRFNDKILKILIQDASENFNWSGISPTIFGAIFESTLNPETRRSGGMHYTSIENIHKVIDPLFLDDLKTELAEIKQIAQERTRNQKLTAYQQKLAGLKFLDPACGSGNFLTETYLSLRKLENEAIAARMQLNGQTLVMDAPIQVSIGQFYGIEINDFAVAVAKTALWIAEAQMLQQTEIIAKADIDFLPLKNFENIVEANALRIDWNEVVPKEELNYIMGNPPFIGARMKSKEQANEIEDVFGKEWKGTGNLDYVACWYKKASDYITAANIRCAFVSTNSITQGEQVSILWKPLFENGLHFDFAYRTFIWDSEANLKAHVYCVIIGFSKSSEKKQKTLYVSSKNGETMTSVAHIVGNINPYLIDAEDVFIASRETPICDVPKIGIGNKPIDNGNYLFNEEEYQAFVRKEPKAEKYFRRIYGAEEFINGKMRYCLWLGECAPEELLKMPECLKRVDAVRKYRLASKSVGTVKLAEKPTRFHVENMPSSTYIVIPETSSQQREYIPMGFFEPEILCTNSVKIVQNALKWHFAVLTSSVHMAWMRAVCGRLKSDYRYSKDIVYSNFPWPTLSDSQKEELNKTAQKILDARAENPNCSLADMYGEKMYLFASLQNAHKENDKAVLKAYGLKPVTTEEEIVAFLMKKYQELVKG